MAILLWKAWPWNNSELGLNKCDRNPGCFFFFTYLQNATRPLYYLLMEEL